MNAKKTLCVNNDRNMILKAKNKSKVEREREK